MRKFKWYAAEKGEFNLKFKLSLLDNAYDFLHNSLYWFHLATGEDYPEDYKRFWRFSLLDMVQSLELMFKEVLKRENPILLFENMEKPKHTVSISTALKRLKKINKIDLEPRDEIIFRKAIELRNQIIHFEIEFDSHELSTIYIVIFEFLHSFHYRFLGKELHECIHPDYWEEEALLIERFRNNLVLYGGVEVSKDYPVEIAESQLFTSFSVKGEVYKRIKFGEERSNSYALKQTHCGDCLVKKGYYHTLGCDLEICPKCGGQAISCSCNLYDELYEEEYTIYNNGWDGE